jgi:hypothetical protein
LGDARGFGDVGSRDFVEVAGRKVRDGGFEKRAPGQFSLRLSLSRGSWRLSAGSHR